MEHEGKAEYSDEWYTPRDPDMESRSMNAAQCIEFLREEVECALSNDWPMTASNLRECANCIESLLLIANEPRKQEVALQREDER